MNIGVFDSGLGGLWILKYLEEELPQYNFIYFADQIHIPYGSHTPDQIIKFSTEITDFLFNKDCMLVVVACNTATSSAISTLREKYKIPFVGIEPAIKPASQLSKTGHIGVLATKVTVEGQKLHDNIERFASNIEVHTTIGYGLVELVEEGKADTDEAEALLRKYLEPLLEENIDQLVLGCTHYAFLINRIKKIVGDKVHIIDPAPSVVRRVKQLIIENNILPTDNKKEPEIFTSGSNAEKVKEFFNNIKLPHTL
ncbi:MAG: glutamate racemase [Patescibacteria group bacterium]|nr:glutamate racemase [Patescibacteria group bacterium]